MGKKSRSKAAKSAAGRSDQTGAGVGSGPVIGIGKQRCVNCSALLKDASKAHACPGCSEPYCWRCEKKLFGECPNGSRCAQPMRRCCECAYGGTMQKHLGEVAEKRDDGRFSFSHGTAAPFMECIEKDPRLGVGALPFRSCGTEGCEVHECYLCVSGADSTGVRRLMSCGVCKSKPYCQKCFVNSYGPLKAMATRVSGTTMQVGEVRKMLVEEASDVLVACYTCKFVSCISCFDDRTMNAFIKGQFSNGPKFQCSICYWSSKPCTNPACPNEPGFPTKRCGDCHLARYCSAECQAADYPAQKIKEKRMVACGVTKASED